MKLRTFKLCLSSVENPCSNRTLSSCCANLQEPSWRSSEGEVLFAFASVRLMMPMGVALGTRAGTTTTPEVTVNSTLNYTSLEMGQNDSILQLNRQNSFRMIYLVVWVLCRYPVLQVRTVYIAIQDVAGHVCSCWVTFGILTTQELLDKDKDGFLNQREADGWSNHSVFLRPNKYIKIHKNTRYEDTKFNF